jgi:hypothetical protein
MKRLYPNCNGGMVKKKGTFASKDPLPPNGLNQTPKIGHRHVRIENVSKEPNIEKSEMKRPLKFEPE